MLQSSDEEFKPAARAPWRVLRLFFLYFAALWILCTAGLFVLVGQELNNQDSQRNETALRQVGMLKNLAELEIRSVVSDVLALALYPELGRLLNSDDPAGHRTLANIVLAYCRNRRDFVRLSLVDKRRREVVRVHAGPGAARIAGQAGLDRPSRDQDLELAERLAPNEILVHSQDSVSAGGPVGRTEPWLLKMAVPLYGVDGQRAGTLLAEHSGPELVRNISDEMMPVAPRFLVIDARGRLLHQGPAGPEGAAVPRLDGVGFARLRPEVWARLTAQDAGLARFQGESYYFQTVRPGFEGLKQSTGAGRAVLASAAAGGFSVRHWWKVVVFQPDSGWAARLQAPLLRWLPPYAAAVLGLGLGCWALAVVVARRQEAWRARRLARERLRLRSAFEHAAMGMAILSLDGRFLLVNQHLCAMLGRSREEFGELPVQALIQPEDQPLLSSAQNAVLERGKASVSQDLRLCDAEGRTVFSRVSLALFSESRGRPLHLIAHVQDLSDSKRLQAEKETMEAELRQAQKLEAIGTLASGIAHDMNNILGIMNANTELALLDLDRDSASLLALRLGRVLRAGNRGRELVAKILNFCQLSDAERQPLELVREVDEAVKLLEASLPKNVTFRKNYSQSSPRVLASFADLQQIMANLCLNASQAMSEGGGTITIKVGEVWPEQLTRWGSREVPPGRWAVIRVSDTGHGMDPQIRRRIFDPFFTTKANGGGTGLGLATVQRIVNNLGGLVTVESQPELGSSFNVILPVTDQQAAPAAAPQETPHLETVGRILLVDDEVDFAGVLGEGLEQLGHSVTAVNHPQMAWRRFQDDPDGFDLLITDQHMGRMSGTDLAERVHGLRPHLPIVLCSGSYHTLDLDRERSIGVVRILRKPFSIMELNGLLNQLLAEPEDSRLRMLGG